MGPQGLTILEPIRDAAKQTAARLTLDRQVESLVVRCGAIVTSR